MRYCRGKREPAGSEWQGRGLHQGAWPVAVTHFSRPSPTTAILLLSSVQAMSLIFPPKGWYSYFSRCSFCVVSQIRIFPDTSAQRDTHTLKNNTHTHTRAERTSEPALTARRDVETAGRVFGHDNLMRMLGVDVCDRWVLQERVYI